MSARPWAALLIRKGDAVDVAQCDLVNGRRIGVGGLYSHCGLGTRLTDPDLELAARLLAGDLTLDVLVLAVDHHFGVARSADLLAWGA